MVGAPDEPPGFAKSLDLAARAHESAVSNFGQGVMAKGYLREKELLVLLDEALHKFDQPEQEQLNEQPSNLGR